MVHQKPGRAKYTPALIDGKDELGYLDLDAKRKLVEIYSYTGSWEKAERVIATISGSATPTELQVRLTTMLALADLWEDAERICSAISPLWRQVKALGNLGLLRMQRKEYEQAQILWKQAEQIATKCKYRWHQAKAFAELGTALAKAGEREWAQYLWKKAETVCGSIKAKSPQVLGLLAVATALWRAGEQEQASKIQAMSEHTYVSNEYKDNSSVTKGLRELCLALIEVNFWEEAERICTTVMITKTISAECDKEDTQMELAKMLAHAGLWEKAEQMSDSLPPEWRRVTSLSYVGTALSRLGERDQANRLWKKVIQLCAMISAPPLFYNTTTDQGIDQWQWLSFQRMSDVLVREGAREDIDQVLHCIQGEWQRLWLLNELATTLIQAREWNEAYQISVALPNERQRAEALGTLSIRLAQAGLWQEAERASEAIERVEEQVRNLIEVTRILVLAENMEPARFLWDKTKQVRPH